MKTERVVIHLWVDCPACPSCGANVAVPVQPGDRFYPAKSGTANLWCPACGQGFEGFPGEVEQAKRAQAAWEEQENKWEAEGRERERIRAEEAKVARLKEGRW